MRFFYQLICLLVLCTIATLDLSAQDERYADSLKQRYYESDTQDLDLLLEISNYETNPDSILKYADLVIKKDPHGQVDQILHAAYLQRGNAYLFMGVLDKALESYFASMDYAKKFNSNVGVGKLNISIADIYSQNGDSANAALYYQKGIEILREESDSLSLAKALLNAGDWYYLEGSMDMAVKYTRESESIFKKMNSAIGQAYSLGNLGMVFASNNNDVQAVEYINEAILILEELRDYYPISVYLTYMSDIYLERNDQEQALEYGNRSLDLAYKYGLKEQIGDAHLNLSELYEEIGEHDKSLDHYKNHIIYRDSINNVENIQELANIRTNYAVSQKQLEVDLLTQQKRNQRITVIATIVALVFIAFLALGLYRRNKFIQKTKAIIEKEKIRSDNLLLNILPVETAEELKTNGKVAAKKFESVTVLFTDFKGFTSYAENLPPEQLVESVDYYYSKFDEIMDKYGLEKIKTVGDAYMCAGGLPYPTNDHAHKMVGAALDIAEFVKTSKDDKSTPHTSFDVRIGINTGPVVAGVVGTKKFAYDIWGDTVNIAARMESSSEIGRINVSEQTYELVKDLFDCEFRGEIQVKNRGMMKMYFVNGYF